MHIVQNLKVTEGIWWKVLILLLSLMHPISFPSDNNCYQIFVYNSPSIKLSIYNHTHTTHTYTQTPTHTPCLDYGKSLLFFKRHENNALYYKIQILWADINCKIKTCLLLLLEENFKPFNFLCFWCPALYFNKMHIPLISWFINFR